VTGGDEEPLVGQGVTAGIVRVGDTVRRPVRPFTATVQAYLAHVHAQGFADAPVPLGFDGQGRELLSFVPGEAATEPLGADLAADDVLVALARLVRRLDDASLGWAPPRDAVWGGVPGAAAPGVVGLFDEPELVGHRDFYPGNVILRDGLPAALIDFDLAAPTTRLYEVANALYWWAPLLDPVDRGPAFVDLDIPHRVAVFADAYRLGDDDRARLVPFAAAMIHNFHLTARESARLDPVFAEFWESGVRERMPRAEAWIAANGPAIHTAVTATTKLVGWVGSFDTQTQATAVAPNRS
jgi:Phosphotransferase enzyme family